MDFAQKLIEGTQEVFSTMLMKELEGKSLVPDSPSTVQSNLTSMIGLGGDIRGLLAIHCPAAVAKNITGDFLGFEVDSLDEDVKDAIGEVANMVAGNLKVSFSEAEINVELAIPTTVIGDSFKVNTIKGSKRFAALFEFGADSFEIELLYVNS